MKKTPDPPGGRSAGMRLAASQAVSRKLAVGEGSCGADVTYSRADRREGVKKSSPKMLGQGRRDSAD